MSNREKLSPAESSFGKEIFEVPPGAGQGNSVKVSGYSDSYYTRYVYRVKINMIFNRVEPRIISSLRRWDYPFFVIFKGRHCLTSAFSAH